MADKISKQMTKTHIMRLEKLAAFLDKLPRKKFDFSDVVTAFDPEKYCGTVGCAIGWTPAVFPDLVEWGRNCYGANVFLRATHRGGYNHVAENLFGVTYDESEKLFSPYCEACPLGVGATPKQVAREIRKFIKEKQGETFGVEEIPRRAR